MKNLSYDDFIKQVGISINHLIEVLKIYLLNKTNENFKQIKIEAERFVNFYNKFYKNKKEFWVEETNDDILIYTYYAPIKLEKTLRDLDLKYKYKIFSIQDFLKNKNKIKNIYEFIESNRYYFLFLNVKNFEYDIRGNL
ncbi:MAG: hypothetical protein J6T10_11410 [Methanobrevibacter sp.]|nr:hypothetical protein [Methanobrevibacter sp.]